MLFAMFTSADIKDGIFGPNTADTEFRAKSPWVIIRGNRYQVLEGEFKGTPFRSLPARKKPLIQLGSDYYAVDPVLLAMRGIVHSSLISFSESQITIRPLKIGRKG